MNWGFLGFGRIARKFLESLEAVDGEKPFAFASRSNADALAKEFPNVKVYDDYQKLLADPEVDIIYISTTHNFHCQNVIDALRAGKHVLCEKPMGISSAEIQKMMAVAEETGQFLMEAMWMRFLPAYREAIALVKNGGIGEVKYMTASFGFRSVDKLTQKGRLLNPDLAGGALFDVGVYPLTIMSDLFGWEPESFHAEAQLSSTGVDETIQMQFTFESGQLAQLLGSIGIQTNKEACIYGTEGFVRIPLFWKAQSYEVVKDDEVERFDLPYKSTGYSHEIEEVVACIAAGKKESNLFTLNDSLMSARLVESILSTIFNKK
jgi:predicted dehydrogenase